MKFISENKLLNYFIPHFNIISQAVPNWLGQQRFDIYLIDYNIAIEYQGAQHFYPVSRFGGENQFLKMQKYDECKRNLCLKYNCELYYFTYTPKDVPKDYPYKVYSDEFELLNDINKSINM